MVFITKNIKRPHHQIEKTNLIPDRHTTEDAIVLFVIGI
jgi:hypothetical protein